MEEKNRPRQPQEEEQPSALSDMLGALGFKSKSQRAGKQENIRDGTEEDVSPDGETQLEREVRESEWGRAEQPDELSSVPAEISPKKSPPPPRKKRRWIFPMIGVAAVAVVGTGFLFTREPDPPSPDVVASYDGKIITVDELNAFIAVENAKEREHIICPTHGYDHSKCTPDEECEAHPVHTLEGYREMVSRLATEQMIVSWAESSGITQRSDVRHGMSDLLNDAMVTQYVSQLHEENISPESISSWEVQKYYDSNQSEYAGKTLSEVENEIRQTLAAQKDEDFFAEYLDELKKTAGLQVNFDLLKVAQPTQAEIDAYYQANQSSYETAPAAKFREIKFSGDDAGSQATAAGRKLRSGESFDSVAASNGGAVDGSIEKGAGPQAKETALWRLKAGQTSDPIDNGDGTWSILELQELSSAGVRPLSEVQEEITWTLLSENTAREYETRKTETLFSIHSRRYTLGDFYTEFQELSPAYQRQFSSFEMKQQLLEQIIAQELLLEKSGDGSDTGEDHSMEELRIRYLAQILHQDEVDDQLIEPTEEEVRQFYEENQADMVVPATFQLNLIWIDQGTNGEKKEDARTKANSALDALTGGMDFAAVARQYSDDSSAASNGGQISGSFHAEDLVEPLAQAIEPLAAGETSPIVEYDGGYYIIQVRDRTEERQQTFEEVADTIKAHLQAQQHEQLEADMQNTLLERANLVIYDKTLRRLVKETEQGAAS